MEANRNKLSLALSGGGFRASLFHIGVLAYLAEQGLLKNVEVISCVSGGSIIGAFYYLHLKKLLEGKKDEEILNEDYINLVKELESDFLLGVKKNIRVREYSNVFKNILMIRENYSNSDRMAELYDKMFYNKFSTGSRIKMRELVINPAGKENIDIRLENIGRKNKIPLLILNSTTLNTGRNWQFTPVDSGERIPDSENINFDKNSVLRAFKYSELNESKFKKYKDMPLSIAVAASACVPAIFTPLALTKLYPDTVPQLVDGGVFDNQGLSVILYENSTDVIVSDASGQMEFKKNMGSDIVNVLSRTNSNLMNRIRNLGLDSILLNKEANIIEEVEIIHLLEDTGIEILNPGDKEFTPQEESPKTNFGVDRVIHDLISEIRTDLDCFTDVEGYSLMFEAYQISQKLIGNSSIMNKYGSKSPLQDWEFLKIKEYAEGKIKCNDYEKQLSISSKVIFKAILLNPLLTILIILIFLISLIPISSLYYYFSVYSDIDLFLKYCLFSGIIFFVPWLVNTITKKRIKFLNWLKLPFALILSPIVSINSSLYLLLINPFIVKRGSINKLRNKITLFK